MHRRADHADTRGEPEEPAFVMFVVGPDGELIDPAAPPPPRPTVRDLGRVAVDAGRATVHATRDEVEARRAASAGKRLLREVQPFGPDGGSCRDHAPARRAGHSEEICITLATRPSTARPAALRGEQFTRPIRRLQVDGSSQEVNPLEVSWRAVLRTGPLRRRDATLRFFASPSSNVSVLTLIPAKPHRVHTRAFIRAGLRAMNELKERLDRELPGRASTAPGPVQSANSG